MPPLAKRPAAAIGIEHRFKHAIQNQDVAVDVQLQGTAETLDEGDDAGARAAAGREARPAGKVGLDGTDDDRNTAPERPKVCTQKSRLFMRRIPHRQQDNIED